MYQARMRVESRCCGVCVRDVVGLQVGEVDAPLREVALDLGDRDVVEVGVVPAIAELLGDADRGQQLRILQDEGDERLLVEQVEAEGPEPMRLTSHTVAASRAMPSSAPAALRRVLSIEEDYTNVLVSPNRSRSTTTTPVTAIEAIPPRSGVPCVHRRLCGNETCESNVRRGSVAGIQAMRPSGRLISALQSSRREGPLWIVEPPLIAADRSTVDDPLPPLSFALAKTATPRQRSSRRCWATGAIGQERSSDQVSRKPSVSSAIAANSSLTNGLN